MNFFFDGEGNLINNSDSNLRQSSNRANVINFIAPVSPSAVVYIGYQLPNGYISYRYPMTLTTATGLNGVEDENGNKFYLWRWVAKGSLTAYSGNVKITFYINTGEYNAVGALYSLEDYIGYYIIQHGAYTLVTAEDAEYLDITVGRTIAYVSDTSSLATFTSIFSIAASSESTLPEEAPEDVWAAFESLYMGLADRLNDVDSVLNEITGDVSDIELAIEGLDDRLDTAENDIDNLESAVDGLDDRLDSAESDIRTINGDITVIINDIADIEELIPAQASAENKLADKAFVNSSIATNTAYFIGTFSSVSELESYSGTITNNDYANVINSVRDFASTDEMLAYNKALLTNYDYAWIPNGTNFDLYRFDIVSQTWGLRQSNVTKNSVSLITAYNRYKYNSLTTEWEWEYTINTSGFTAAQWAAINSGITTGLVTDFSAHIAATNNPHAVTKQQVGLSNVDNTSDADKPISNATQIALNRIDDMFSRATKEFIDSLY